jgi:hypothetical protein
MNTAPKLRCEECCVGFVVWTLYDDHMALHEETDLEEGSHLERLRAV